MSLSDFGSYLMCGVVFLYMFVRLRVSYTGVVRELYESVVRIDGVVGEEYVQDVSKLEGEVVDGVVFTCDIVFASYQVDKAGVVSGVESISGVEGVTVVS